MVSGTRIATIAAKALAAVMAVVVALALVLGGLVAAGVVDVAPPTVESADSEWGQVDENATTLRTEVVVDNPNPVGFPGVLSLEYAASMNDVMLVRGEEGGVGLSSGETTIELTDEMDNDRIVEWWVGHVNRGETSQLAITAEVNGPLGISETVPVRESSFETDMLGGLQGDERQSLTANGQEVAVLHGTSASWDQANESVTPLTLEATIENTERVPITVRDLEYDVAFNDVVLADATATESYVIAPGETETVQFTLELDSSKMDEWWVSHVRNGETTTATFETAVTVEAAGASSQFELSPVEQTVETDVLNGTASTGMSGGRSLNAVGFQSWSGRSA